ILERARARLVSPVAERLDTALARHLRDAPAPGIGGRIGRPSIVALVASGGLALLVLYGGYRAAGMLTALPIATWRPLVAGLGATFLRVAAALLIALARTGPAGVPIGSNRRPAALRPPILPAAACIPPAALFA